MHAVWYAPQLHSLMAVPSSDATRLGRCKKCVFSPCPNWLHTEEPLVSEIVKLLRFKPTRHGIKAYHVYSAPSDVIAAMWKRPKNGKIEIRFLERLGRLGGEAKKNEPQETDFIFLSFRESTSEGFSQFLSWCPKGPFPQVYNSPLPKIEWCLNMDNKRAYYVHNSLVRSAL